jgi:cyclopropane-fatty-acyl-phospholipid synthase
MAREDPCCGLVLAKAGARPMLLSRMLRPLIRLGRLTVIDADGHPHVFGSEAEPAVTIRLRDRRLHWQLVLNPGLHAGEAYMDGTLTVEEGTLYDFVELMAANLDAAGRGAIKGPVGQLRRWLRRLTRRNTPSRSERNVAQHYDLSGELYELFLDSERQYTCAYHPTGTEDIEQAQRAKERHIAAKLLLAPGQRVVDLGCGWGSLSLHLARHHHVDVTGVTLSREQYEWANARAAELGLADRARFLHRDYRDVGGQFDRVVSIGMLEHVGVANFGTLFTRIQQMLTPDGIGLVHSIGRMRGPGATNPWVRKHIFPGGYIPALSEVLPAIERSGLWVCDVEILRVHYAHTLRLWRERFQANRERAAALYDERFCRMWEYYLATSEISFRHLDNYNFQIQLARRRDAVPLTRDYIHAGEHGFASVDSTTRRPRLVENAGGGRAT